MNKEDKTKINNRIENLRLEFDANQKKIGLLQVENHRIQGAVTELNLVLVNLVTTRPPKKKKDKAED